MPRIEVNTIKAGNYAYYNNAINYVARDDKCIQGYIGASNLLLPQDRTNIVKWVDHQVDMARMHYNQEDRRLGIHCIFEFTPEEVAYLEPTQILEIGYYLAMTEFAACMTYFSVHDHTQCLHLDMLIFPLNIHTGRMYACQKEGWKAIEFRLQKHLLNYMPQEDIGGFQVSYNMAKNRP